MEMFLALLPIVYIYFPTYSFCESVFYQQKPIMTVKLLKQGERYHNRKTFPKFYHRHIELLAISKTLLQQDILEPIFYGDLVYKFKRIVGKPNFSDEFKTILKRCKKLDITCISRDSLHAWL